MTSLKSWLFRFQAFTLCTQSAGPDQYPRRERREEGGGEIQTSLSEWLKLERSTHTHTHRPGQVAALSFKHTVMLEHGAAAVLCGPCE